MYANLNKFQALLENKQQAILLSSDYNRLYGTGSSVEESLAVVCHDGLTFFTDSRYIEAARRDMPDFDVRMTDQNHTALILLKEVLEARQIRQLGIEEKVMTVAEYRRLEQGLGIELFFIQDKLDACREAKEDWELERMLQAQQITDAAFADLCGKIRAGMTEKEVETLLITALYRHGADGMAFAPIVVSGPNSSMPHGVAGQRKLRAGDFLTMDFGARYRGYCADMTRTVAIGYATDRMRQVYDTVLQAQAAGIAATRAGIPGCQVDAAARKVIAEAGYGAYFGHGYGHGLGIRIHEGPNCNPSGKKPLPVGAVCSAEPGISLPGKFGVRIEDVVIVQADGCRDITRSPKELIIL